MTLVDALTSRHREHAHVLPRHAPSARSPIVPDTPAKRREYEEAVVQTFYLSNADIKEVIDLLRIVVDVRQISPHDGHQRHLAARTRPSASRRPRA